MEEERGGKTIPRFPEGGRLGSKERVSTSIEKKEEKKGRRGMKFPFFLKEGNKNQKYVKSSSLSLSRGTDKKNAPHFTFSKRGGGGGGRKGDRFILRGRKKIRACFLNEGKGGAFLRFQERKGKKKGLPSVAPCRGRGYKFGLDRRRKGEMF